MSLRTTMFCGVLLVAVSVAPGALAEEYVRAPDAAALANGSSAAAALGSGCATGPRSGMCADTVWPPAGLGAPLPVTPGGVVRLTFTGPVTLTGAGVGGRSATFTADSPTSWLVTLPGSLGDGLLSTSVLWQSGDWHGDQVYGVALAPAAALVSVRGARATVETKSAGTVRLALVRGTRTVRAHRFNVTAPGRRTYGLRPAGRAHLRVTFTPSAGPPVVLRH